LLGQESSLRYHDYVIGLLTRIAAVTGDTTWAEAAARFAHYRAQPPALTAATVSPEKQTRSAAAARATFGRFLN